LPGPAPLFPADGFRDVQSIIRQGKVLRKQMDLPPEGRLPDTLIAGRLAGGSNAMGRFYHRS